MTAPMNLEARNTVIGKVAARFRQGGYQKTGRTEINEAVRDVIRQVEAHHNIVAHANIPEARPRGVKLTMQEAVFLIDVTERLTAEERPKLAALLERMGVEW